MGEGCFCHHEFRFETQEYSHTVSQAAGMAMAIWALLLHLKYWGYVIFLWTNQMVFFLWLDSLEKPKTSLVFSKLGNQSSHVQTPVLSAHHMPLPIQLQWPPSMTPQPKEKKKPTQYWNILCYYFWPSANIFPRCKPQETWWNPNYLKYFFWDHSSSHSVTHHLYLLFRII